MINKYNLFKNAGAKLMILIFCLATALTGSTAFAGAVIGDYCTTALNNLSDAGILGADGKVQVTKEAIGKLYQEFLDVETDSNEEHKALDALLDLAQNAEETSDRELATQYLLLLSATTGSGNNFFITPKEFLDQAKFKSDEGKLIRTQLLPVYTRAVAIAHDHAVDNDGKGIPARKAYALALKELDLSEAAIFRAGAPSDKIQKELDATKLGPQAQALHDKLAKLVVGQPEIVGAISEVMQQYYSNLKSPNHPIGNILIMGPTGTGKTRAAEALAEVLYGDPNAKVKIDAGEFQHSHEIAKLIGSPPGYLGHRETTPALSQEALNRYFTDKTKVSIVLIDEIEKSSDALWQLLLGILDKGTLTLGDNRKVDFSNAIIFMTSNVGAEEMQNMITPPKLGFAVSMKQKDEVVPQQKVDKAAIAAMRRKFSPEFVNRLDKIAVARFLTNSNYRKILEYQLGLIQTRIYNTAGERAFTFELTRAAKDELLMEGIDPKYGARPLLRTLERDLVMRFGSLLETGQVKGGQLVRVDYDFVNEKWSLNVVGQAPLPPPPAKPQS